MKSRKEIGDLLDGLMDKKPMEVWDILMELKDDGEIVGFVTYETNDRLDTIEVFLDSCVVCRERNE